MRRRAGALAGLCLLGLALVMGCGSGQRDVLEAIRTPKAVYAIASNSDSGDSFLYAYSIDAGTGELKPAKGSPYQVPSSCVFDIVVTRTSVFINCGTAVLEYAVMPDGSLTQLPNVPLPPYPRVFALAADPTGRFLYVSDLIPAAILEFSIGADGRLTPLAGSPMYVGDPYGPQILTMDPGGRYLFTFNLGVITSYFVDEGTGELTLTPHLAVVPTTVDQLLVEPTGRFLYVKQPGDVRDQGNQLIHAFRIDVSNAALKPVPGAPFEGALPNGRMAAEPTGRFLFLASAGFRAAGIEEFGIAAGGELVPVGDWKPVASFELPSLAADPSGQFLYAVGANRAGTARTLLGYRINEFTGAIEPLDGSPFAADDSPVLVVTH